MAIKDCQDYAIPMHDLSYVTFLTNNQVVRDLVFVRLFFFLLFNHSRMFSEVLSISIEVKSC